MNKHFRFIGILSALIISSCSNNAKDIEESTLSIKNFNLSHYSKNGNKLYKLETPYSIFNKKEQVYLLDKTSIKFFQKNNIKYIVNSDSSRLINNNKVIELKGNVKISDIENNNTTIKSDNLYWDINKSKFRLEGKVYLITKSIKLNSSMAVLDKESNIITFFKPVEYSYIDQNNISKYDIKSENAYYNIENQDVIFKSENNKVRSRIIF